MVATKSACGKGMRAAKSTSTSTSSELEYDRIRLSRTGEKTGDYQPTKRKFAPLAPKSTVTTRSGAKSAAPIPPTKAQNAARIVSEAVRYGDWTRDSVFQMNTSAPTNERALCTPSEAQSTERIVHEAAEQAAKNQAPASRTSNPMANGHIALAPKLSGSATNPIDVETLKTPSPHKFLHRPYNYFAPITLEYKPSRARLAPRLVTPNGAHIAGQAGGHQSHDIYRTLMAKQNGLGSVHSIHPSTAPQPSALPTGMAFQAGYRYQFPNSHTPQYGHPVSAAHQQYHSMYNPYGTIYHSFNHSSTPSPAHNEDLLRKRTVQYVLDNARPRPRKRRISGDPDATSGSEYEEENTPPRKRNKGSRSSTETSPQRTVNAPTDSEGARILRLTELIEHTQLMTSLLQAYPHSTDTIGLREDMAMLLTVSNKRIGAWLTSESERELANLENDHNRPKTSVTESTNITTPSPYLSGTSNANAHAHKSSQVVVLTDEMIRRKEMEDEVKRYLSAASNVWDNKGMCIADVYTATVGSSPAVSSTNGHGASQDQTPVSVPTTTLVHTPTSIASLPASFPTPEMGAPEATAASPASAPSPTIAPFPASASAPIPAKARATSQP